MNNTLRDTNSRIDQFSASILSRLRRDRSIARMVVILLVAIGIFSILSPSVFLTGLNLQNMLLAVAEIGILSIAMMISMVTGGIDLSLVAIANLCAITVSTLYTSSALGGTEQWGPVIILIGLGVGLVCGLVNGVRRRHPDPRHARHHADLQRPRRRVDGRQNPLRIPGSADSVR